MSFVWLVEERLSKRRAWKPCGGDMPYSKNEAIRVAEGYRERTAGWVAWEYRVVKYVREEPAK